jgi:ATP-dependent Clp protease ATP-binding subunit ClpA
MRSLKDQGYDALTGQWQEKTADGTSGPEITAEKNKGQAPAPTPQIDDAMRERLRTLADVLKARVIGQDQAADSLTQAVRRGFAGLKEDNKTLGNFLFIGPTGVGKTEETRQLAEALGYSFKKIDMSEYKEKHNVARMIGAPHGYRDSGQGGTLVDFIEKNPKTVLLLDEIEKAHPDVYDVLLQIMDDAQLTGGMGNTVRFNETILIMTSNLGTALEQTGKQRMGFLPHTPESGASEDPVDVDLRKDPVLNSHFRLEFLNRIDSIVRFHSLTPENMGKIVDIFAKQLQDKLAKKNTTIDISPAAKDWLAVNGHDEVLGARPLKRLIATTIEEELANELLFGQLKTGGHVDVTVSPPDLGIPSRLVLTFNKSANGQISNDNVARPSTATQEAKPLPAPAVA